MSAEPKRGQIVVYVDLDKRQRLAVIAGIEWSEHHSLELCVVGVGLREHIRYSEVAIPDSWHHLRDNTDALWHLVA